jgi:hypothetical protein
MSKSILDSLCRMPADFHERGNVSMVALLTESGYDPARSGISETTIEEHLRQHPELVPIWVHYSEDQRCSPAWYLVGPGAGLDGQQSWCVGFYAPQGRLPERAFPNEFAASAFFIMRQVEELARLAG